MWRNEKVHFRRHSGAETIFEYERTMNCILDGLERTNPEDLLPEDHSRALIRKSLQLRPKTEDKYGK